MKALIVYYSWSGTTRTAAREIQKQTGADIFELKPARQYPSDYSAVLKISQQEQKNGARPALAEIPGNVGDYDVIYLGFPNWYGDMPMLLYTFLNSCSLGGKRIAPFCTSGGSGLCDTVHTIKTMAPEATVLNGLSLGGSAAPETIANWLNKIGLAE